MKKVNCVLLVDDSISSIFYNKELIRLSSDDIENVHAVESGFLALDFINSLGEFKTNTLQPSIIFLDMNMPNMDGFEFLERFSQLPETKKKNTLIVILTSHSMVKNKEAIDGYGDLIYGVLQKPLLKKNLSSVLEYYSNHKIS